jgi:hypothetical protein
MGRSYARMQTRYITKAYSLIFTSEQSCAAIFSPMVLHVRRTLDPCMFPSYVTTHHIPTDDLLKNAQ